MQYGYIYCILGQFSTVQIKVLHIVWVCAKSTNIIKDPIQGFLLFKGFLYLYHYIFYSIKQFIQGFILSWFFFNCLVLYRVSCFIQSFLGIYRIFWNKNGFLVITRVSWFMQGFMSLRGFPDIYRISCSITRVSSYIQGFLS